MDYALKLQDVCKQYDNSDFILDKVSFSLPTGSILGFIGENGAGKTTTIGCILNTLTPDSGSIELFGKQMCDTDLDVRENIGVVYDGDNFPGYLTAKQLSYIMSGVYKQWDEPLFYEYLQKFGLKDTQRIAKYSKGMTMKLAIATALSHHPQLLILDEATGGLDPVMREDLLDIFLEFIENEQHSILLSSHITSDLERVADYIAFIHNGRIILTETKDNLIYNYGILRCTDTDFSALDATDILAYHKRDYQIDVLTADMKNAAKKYKNIVIDHASIDEIMLILVKGNII